MHVYFIQGQTTRLIKIGHTRGNTEHRITSMQTGSPDKLKILKVVEAEKGFEKTLHKKFASIRCHGEWFYPSRGLMAFIDGLDGIKIVRNRRKTKERRINDALKLWEQGFSKGEIESELGAGLAKYLPIGHNPKYDRGKRARQERMRSADERVISKILLNY